MIDDIIDAVYVT